VLGLPVVLVLLGAGLLVVGWQGLRLNTQSLVAHLSDEERSRRRILLYGGGSVCVACGAVLLTLALLMAIGLSLASG
jgi:hypothetical protein